MLVPAGQVIIVALELLTAQAALRQAMRAAN
jgi:hypothetical protein